MGCPAWEIVIWKKKHNKYNIYNETLSPIFIENIRETFYSDKIKFK